jgi:hypothetical protein
MHACVDEAQDAQEDAQEDAEEDAPPGERHMGDATNGFSQVMSMDA